MKDINTHPGPHSVSELHAEGLLRALLGSQRTALLDAPGMLETPGRMARALAELLDGYDAEVDLTSFDVEGEPGIVVVRDIHYSSLCEHHVLPFSGTASVAYIPTKKIIGLSKIPRLVRAFSRRLQVQERLTSQLADSLAPLEPAGVAVVVRGQHTCCSMRGAEADALMVTSAVRGVFMHEADARAEVMALLGAAR